MKMAVLILFIVLSLSLFADLEIDIPFSPNIVADDYSQVGDFTYESDWITMTNNGTTTQTYTMMYNYDTASLPAGWTMSVCNPITCYMPFFPVPIELGPGQTEELSVHIQVFSTGGFSFDMTFAGGDVTEPTVVNFTFNTADNVSSEENIVIIDESVRNYPNPFNPVTNISFSLLEASQVDLNIYNLKGELVRSLLSDVIPSGDNSILWDGRDDSGTIVPSGLYFYKLKAGIYTSTRKMMLMK
ncbi:FlgD immunoglobulin-like domain containing protein [Candidatus Cloacimonadota bacterium]